MTCGFSVSRGWFISLFILIVGLPKASLARYIHLIPIQSANKEQSSPKVLQRIFVAPESLTESKDLVARLGLDSAKIYPDERLNSSGDEATTSSKSKDLLL